MVRLMRYRSQPADQLKLLMYRIGLNVLNDRGRREQARMASVHVSIDDDYLALASPELAHEHRIAQQQALERVRACILKLPPRCRQVYLLNRMEGMSYPQIAAHCAISVKAVEKHIGKALQHLRGSESGVYCGPLRLLAWQVRQGRVGGAGGCAVLLVGWVVRWLQWALGACCVAVHACCLNSNRPQSCWPTSPLQVHDQLCAGGLPTNLVTGQERRQVAGARHTACTTEMASTAHPVDVAVS